MSTLSVLNVQWSLWRLPVVKLVTKIKTKKYKKLFSFQNIRNNAKSVMCNTWEVVKNQTNLQLMMLVSWSTELLNEFEKCLKKGEQELVEEIWYQFNKLGN